MQYCRLFCFYLFILKTDKGPESATNICHADEMKAKNLHVTNSDISTLKIQEAQLVLG